MLAVIPLLMAIAQQCSAPPRMAPCPRHRQPCGAVLGWLPPALAATAWAVHPASSVRQRGTCTASNSLLTFQRKVTALRCSAQRSCCNMHRDLVFYTANNAR